METKQRYSGWLACNGGEEGVHVSAIKHYKKRIYYTWKHAAVTEMKHWGYKGVWFVDSEGFLHKEKADS